MRIKLYQMGGITYLPTVNRMLEEEQTSSASTTKRTSLAKDLIDLVKENGLDSDVSVFLNQIQGMLNPNDPFGENITVSQIVQAQRLANQVKINYESYKNTCSSLEKENAWGEWATTDSGGIYTINNESGKLDLISAKELKENPDNYRVLTNKELMTIRESSTGSAYNTSILNDLSASVGMSTINDYIKDNIKAFETTTITGYSAKQRDQIQTGIDQLQGMSPEQVNALITAGPDGIYKVSSDKTIIDDNIKAALNYIIDSLPKTYRNTLAAKATIDGMDPDTYILTMLVGGTKRSYTADYDNTASKLQGSAGSEGSSAVVQHTLEEVYSSGVDASYIKIRIAPWNSNITFNIVGQNVGPIKDKDGDSGKIISNSSLEKVLQDSLPLRQVTNNTVCFGDKLISESDYKNIMVTNPNIYRVTLPSKTLNGKDIVPDFELQKALDDIVKNGEDSGATTDMINKALAEQCPGATYDKSTGQINLPSDRTHVFLTFEAYGDSDPLDSNRAKEDKLKNSDYLAEAPEELSDLYREIIMHGDTNWKKNDRSNADPYSMWRRNKLMQGNIYIPISSSLIGSTMTNRGFTPKSDYTNLTGREAEHERQMQLRDKLQDSSNTNF